MEPTPNTLAALAAQVTGVLTVAAVMRPFARLVPGRSLTYWWAAWVVLAVSLGLLFAATAATRAGYWFAPVLVGLFCLTDYLFGFLVWAGCQVIDTAGRLPRAAWGLFAPFVVAAGVIPAVYPHMPQALPFHALVAGVPYAVALVALRPRPGTTGDSRPALWVMRLSLTALVVLYWQYPAVANLVGGDADGTVHGDWLQLLLIAGLALGMVALAADRVQAELASKNERLAAAGDELARASRTDPLTGLLNRRAMDDLIADLSARPVGGCLVALDLNNLKPLNDVHGHAAGDTALQVVARSLRTLFRVTDPIFRTGGDEFLVVLPGGSAADARARMATLDAGLSVRPPGAGDREVTLTVAWGVAEFRPGDDLWAVSQEADVAMYLAKKKAKSDVVKVPGPRMVPPTP